MINDLLKILRQKQKLRSFCNYFELWCLLRTQINVCFGKWINQYQNEALSSLLAPLGFKVS